VSSSAAPGRHPQPAYGELKALGALQAQRLVIDATGLGLGLVFFPGAPPGERRVVRFQFTQKSK
jgi:hypothetical protein